MRPSKTKSSSRAMKSKCRGSWVKSHKSHSASGKVEKVKGYCRKSKSRTMKAKTPRAMKAKKPRAMKAKCRGSWVKGHKSHSASGKVEKVKGYCRKSKSRAKKL